MVAVLAAWSSQLSALFVQTPVAAGFTYQGRLTDGDAPARGLYDFDFTLHDALKDGTQIGPRVTQNDIEVTNGLFTVTLDFGAVFSGTRRWLQIGVRPAASDGEYVVLKPRQELTPAPDSLFSQGTPWTGVAGKPSGFADNQDNDVLGGLACTSGQVPKWTGTTWACATGVDDATVQRRTVAPTCPAGQYVRSIAADGTPTCAADADSGGDITGVTAGAGLTGGGIAGSVTLDVSLAGSGSATTVARSDHNHLGASWSGTTIGLVNAPAFSVRNTGTHQFGPIGISGGVDASNGTGVLGTADSETGVNRGVHGVSNTGVGVQGSAAASSGTNYGIYGQTNSTAGYAGYFKGRIGTDSSIDFAPVTRQMINLFNTQYAIGVQPNTLYFRSGGCAGIILGSCFGVHGDFTWFRGGTHSDTEGEAGSFGVRQMRLDAFGHLYVRGTVNPGGADFAEMLPAQDADLQPGDVLVIGSDGALARSTEPYQSTLAGVYSTKPGLLGGAADGEDTTGKIPLAVAGVVPVKVSDENGPIRPGDSLTSSSTPGHAMRASKVTVGGVSFFPSGVVIGKALEPLTSGTGVIRALVVMQ